MKRVAWFAGGIFVLALAWVALLIFKNPHLPLAISIVHDNEPTTEVFDVLLQKGLEDYFASNLNNERRLGFQLLRRGATQVGVAYPKYYAWVDISGPEGRVISGAVRVSAIERQRFEVTDFLGAEEIQKSPSKVSEIFPAPLVSPILERAEVDIQ